MTANNSVVSWQRLQFWLLVSSAVCMSESTPFSVFQDLQGMGVEEEKNPSSPARGPDGNDRKVIRLFLVRHGETVANAEGFVAGQSESPLNSVGRKQAQALGQQEWFSSIQFWRRYVSDMGRTQDTARNLFLDGGESSSLHGWILESRLREAAKGARELRPKWMTHEQALEALQSEQGNDASVPKLESEAQVWQRLNEWLSGLVRDVLQQRDNDDDKQSSTVNILVVSHSGTIRTLLCRLVPTELPEDVDISFENFQNNKARRLTVPNTSVTVVDLFLSEGQESRGENGSYHSRLRVLTWDQHIHTRTN